MTIRDQAEAAITTQIAIVAGFEEHPRFWKCMVCGKRLMKHRIGLNEAIQGHRFAHHLKWRKS